MNGTGKLAATAALALIAVALFSLPMPKSARASDSGREILAEEVDRPPSEVKRSWTPGEMLEADGNGSPLPIPLVSGWSKPDLTSVPESDPFSPGYFTPESPTAWPNRVHGKVFLRSGGENFVCSGTLVDSAGRNVISTAGHCVYDRNAKSFAEDVLFVPAYDGTGTTPEEQMPFGSWPATYIVTTPEYRRDGQLGADIAFFTVSGAPGRVLGGRKIVFDQDSTRRKVTIFGYPARPESLFDGGRMRGCRSTIVGRDTGSARQRINPATLWARPCRMEGGSSGGGWVTPRGFLTSIVSYTYCPSVPHLCGSTFGPVLGDRARDLYLSPEIGGPTRPSVTVTPGSGVQRLRRSVSFRITGSGSTPVSTLCRMDRLPARRCSGTVAYRNLKPGRHVLSVRAVDQTGRRSPVSKLIFTVAGR